VLWQKPDSCQHNKNLKITVKKNFSILIWTLDLFTSLARGVYEMKTPRDSVVKKKKCAKPVFIKKGLTLT
jgi:hypothetical protein